ncbi:hypothetical protein ABIC63_002134 [Pseudacidovorax sp. 1753]|uniref:hypothetical protein n=1 Tax=Pseudacidovorax sp. 1753 TaxID=3156419 RepID=UPI00339B1BE5
MRLRLALALSRYAGQVLTPDLARSILRDVEGADRTIDGKRFGQEGFNGYVIAAETVAGNEAALVPLQAACHEETRPGIPFDHQFDFARQREAERAGNLVLFTARLASTGELVGVLRVRVFQPDGCAHLEVTDDLFYIRPAHRNWLAVHLWRFAERSMFNLGVRVVSFDSLSITGADRMARYLGYTPVATKFTKVAQDACDYQQVPQRRPRGDSHGAMASH